MFDADLTTWALWLGRGVLPKDEAGLRAFAAELDGTPYGAVWIGGSPSADLAVAEGLLAGSDRLLVGTSILNVWTDAPADAAASTARLHAAYGERFVLGIGAGHHVIAEKTGVPYEKPYSKVVAYLDELDAAGTPVRGRAVAALGPRTVELAGKRSAGALPYLTTPEHTRQAREIMGPDALLVAEHAVVLDADPEAARATARKFLSTYLRLPNYVSNWRRLGFTEADVAAPGSDALVDALVLHGEPEAVAERLAEHLDAGADQVAVQPIGPGAREQWTRLAPHLRA